MFRKNNRKFLGPLIVATMLSGCSTGSNRNPSSEQDVTLAQIIEGIRLTSERQKTDHSICKPAYDSLYQQLFNLAGDTTYFDMNNIEAIDREIKASWNARIALKATFKDFDADPDCLKSATDVFRGLRYVEDYLIEMRVSLMANAPVEYTNLKGEFPYMLVNPKYETEFKSYEDLKSGDVILSRGNAFSSAAIARIGSNDYQFSHLSFVYKNPESQETYTTEAHIEIGSVTAPIMEHVSSKNAREVVFRYEDADVAHRASKYMYDRVLAKQKTKKTIEYDFSMNYKDDERLFCSEVVSSAFKKVLPDADYFPIFKSKFTPGMIPFINTIGVPATKENIGKLDVFSPGDIQFDPRFDLVAEWRNPKKMEENRLKDFILTKIFERMETESYKIDPTFKMDAQSKTFWLLRRLPIVKKFVADKFPLNMSPSQMELFMALDKLGDAIYKEVEKASLEYDRPMTPKEIYVALDNFFKQDFELYKRYKKGQEVTKPSFHLLFHP
ncbi:YiiX/YebB-like N1pC/P60 family cysteine hydrolase [Bacteriovorax sp. PP10]|uniref:YiiX/YebB-like N1pC/P60 family cysteine hydrolase n=1 Tax=Bacteriovorax antarcticus TaxID=3088717 RepID=A0ABU5VYX1_9BACT|nr:YiiX/YebB-like N1pC/P60 family cysteine hydrolase [Bacteriovorax sp. PP10]MEA9358271.1 YiiX/YebB-like N1pC/P60 family cysteine hydrolase [Bacteriovorax sp. PP10]